MSTQQPPDAWTCPYGRQCFQRELLRWLAAVIVAAVTGYMAGCTSKLIAPGLTWEVNWTDRVPPATMP